MVSIGVGMAMPGHWPTGPAPEGVTVSHGYGCTCVAQAFGKLPFNKVRTRVCRLSDDAYLKALLDANEAFISAKSAGAGDEAIAAYRALADRAVELENFTLAFGADADVGDLHYRRGELHLARAAAQRVLDAMPGFYATVTHYQQFVEVRPCEASRDIAERTLINIDIEELRLDDAGALIERQRERNVQRRATEAQDPGQFTPSMLIAFGLDDLELEVLRARLAVARGDQAGAARHLDGAVAALTGWAPPDAAGLTDADRDGLRAQARTIGEMARAERTRLDINTGRADEGHAGLVSGRLRGVVGFGDEAHLIEMTEADSITKLRELYDEQLQRGQPAQAAETAFTLGCRFLEADDAEAALKALAEAERGWREVGQTAAQEPRLALPRALALTGIGRHTEALVMARDAAQRFVKAGAGFDAVRADVMTGMIAAQVGDVGHADIAVAAALGSDVLRYTLTTAPEREAWDAAAVQPAMELAIELLSAADRPSELAALLERLAAVGALSPGSPTAATAPIPTAHDPAEGARPAMPPGNVGALAAPQTADELLTLTAGAAPLAAGGVDHGTPDTWQLAPPPETPALAAALRRARRRYRLPEAPDPAPTRATVRSLLRAPERGTVTVRFVEVGGMTYRVWRSSMAPDQPDIAMVNPAWLPAPLDVLQQALPTPLPGEDQAAALTRAAAGALGSDRLALVDLLANLGTLLLHGVAGPLAAHPSRPRLLIQPSRALENVPWALLTVPAPDLNPTHPHLVDLIDLADIAVLAPEGVAAAAAPVTEGAGLLRVIEPAGTGLGRLLREEATPSSGPEGRTRQRCRYTRTDLAADLAYQPAAFMYLGHVGAPGMTSGLQLSDGTLTALDLAALPMPPRVALLGCASAQDVARADAASLPRAAITAGAEVIIATPWTLPTATGLGSRDGEDPLADLGNAVEQALQAPDPVAACTNLVREARSRWHSGSGSPPLLWGGVLPLVRNQTWDR